MNFKRVVVLGMDGLDPGILEGMMAAGKLPHFAKLRDEGTFARLQTSIPPESPVAWLSAATGANPGRHGVFDFIGRDPETYLPDLSILRLEQSGGFRLLSAKYVPVSKSKAFWDILSENGIATSVIRWPVTFPPEAVNGRLLAGLGTPDITGTLGHYTFYTTAPMTPKDKAPDRVVTISWNSDTINTRLAGPQVASFTGSKTSSVQVRIERTKDGRSLMISLGKATPFRLKMGEWSDWIGIEFPAGLSRNCPAMVRMYLTSVHPELALYVSPLHIDPMKPAFPLTHPADFSRRLAETIGPFHTLGLPEDTQAARHGRIPVEVFLEQCDQITKEREKMLEGALARLQSGLLAIVFDTSDRIQHMFWAARDPSHPGHTAELKQKYGEVIADHYRRMDAVLRRTAEAVGKETAIFVMSDHGFASFKRAAHLNTWLVQSGFMTLDDDSNGEGAPLLKSVDWQRTRVYAVGFCSLYVNLKGREGEGIVTRGQERRELIEELTQALKSWKDPATGDPVVRNVYVAEEVFQGGHLKNAPDLVVGYYPGHRASWQTAVGAAPAGEPIVDNDDLWSGDHLVDAPCVPGIFLSNIPCKVQNPRLIDIAPTVLQALGIAPDAEMDGRALQ